MIGSPTRRRFVVALSLLAPVLVLGVVWWPDLAHYYVQTPSVTAGAVESARRTPDDSLLEELLGFDRFGLTPGFRSDSELIACADKLLRGQVDLPGLPEARITVPFSPDDLDAGPGSWQLALGAFALPDILVRAYRLTRDDRYLFAARDMIVGWANYERHAWLPKGYLWNDHAMAARIPVLAAFWSQYRRHGVYDAAVARTIVEFAARTGNMLARPDHFTFSTNHGVMQNLALWHLYLAFPTLPDAARYRGIALARLGYQMAFYVNSEGVVLEHSAGYHKFGFELLGMALRYLTLMHGSPPDDWADKYRRATLVYAQLRLPGGWLPLIGDTANEPDPLGPLTTQLGPEGQADRLRDAPAWRPVESYSLYPVAGYSIWWDGLAQWPQTRDLSQTVIAWSYFPGHGHKHADELSVSLWAAGQRWWSNVGYWSYDLQTRAQAQSWGGSNAPHLVNEPADSRRESRLVSMAWSEAVAAIHLERRGPGQYLLQRQVLRLRPKIWVIVDHATSTPSDLMRTQWTTSPNIRLEPGPAPGTYLLKPMDSGLEMSAHFLASPDSTFRVLTGSLNPFAGWQVRNHTGAPAPALVVDQPGAGAWSIGVWCLDRYSSDSRPCPARIEGRFTRDEDWTVTFHAGSQSTTLRRADQALLVETDGLRQSAKTIALQAPADVSRQLDELRRAYNSAASQYPRFRDLTRYRIRVSLLLLILFLTQEILFAVATLIRRHYAFFRPLSTLAWAILGMWLSFVYFR